MIGKTSSRVSVFLIVLLGTLSVPHRYFSALQNAAAGALPGDAGTSHASESRSSGTTVIQFFNAYAVGSEVELTWFAFSMKDIRGYQIYRGPAGGGSVFLVNTEGLIPAWQQNYRDGRPRPGATYQYILGVMHTDGSEFFSAPVEVTTPAR